MYNGVLSVFLQQNQKTKLNGKGLVISNGKNLVQIFDKTKEI